MMLRIIVLGAILLTNLVNADGNITCNECTACTTTSMKVSTGNRLCFRVQMDCLAVNIHIVDLMGDRLQSNYSLANCGQKLVYSSACTVAYHCCYTDKCNTFENPLYPQPPASSSSSSLFVLKRIVISFNILLVFIILIFSK